MLAQGDFCGSLQIPKQEGLRRQEKAHQTLGNSLIRRNLQPLPAHVELFGHQHQDQSFKIGSTRTISA